MEHRQKRCHELNASPHEADVRTKILLRTAARTERGGRACGRSGVLHAGVSSTTGAPWVSRRLWRSLTALRDGAEETEVWSPSAAASALGARALAVVVARISSRRRDDRRSAAVTVWRYQTSMIAIICNSTPATATSPRETLNSLMLLPARSR